MSAASGLGSYSLVSVDRQDEAAGDALCMLHEALLPTSPIVGLGHRFMREFYYGALLDADVLFGTLAYVDGEPVGFAVATPDSNGFMRTGALRKWPQLASVMARSLLFSPQRLFPVIEAVRIMQDRESEPVEEQRGELLSVGVLAEFRSYRDENGAPLSIGRDLVDCALDRLHQLGVSRVSAIIDSDNFAAQVFYKSEGWRLARKGIPGWRVPSVEYILDDLADWARNSPKPQDY